MENNIKKIQKFGQSIWLDFIDRKIMDSGLLQRLIEEDGITGITSNPAIFEKAISNSEDYTADIARISEKEESNESIFYELAVEDIKRAADIFKPVYDGEIKGADGYVSLEVSPYLARDTTNTITQALELWKAVGRKNVMIKIPGTSEGISAIRASISEGLNINVTLLFGLNRYEEVTEAYILGLEDRLKKELPIDGITSVASFFLSRIDVLIDPLLVEKDLGNLKGEVAIASAKKAYEIYTRVFTSDRFIQLQQKGAKPQRLLWASTGNKDPAGSDVKYVEALIGPDTVNTVPMETLIAFRDHGIVSATLQADLTYATRVLEAVKKAGIDMDDISRQLEQEGIDKFTEPYTKLLKAINSKRTERKTEITF